MTTQNGDDEQASFPNRSDGVTEAERYLTRLARTSFLSLWSYPNIYRDESLVKKRGTKCEICDLLVVFENHLIIFSDKDCAFQNKGNLDVDWNRWYRGAVLENAKQVWGAERWMISHPGNIFVDRDCTQPFPINLPSADVVKVHRIVVAHSASERCKHELGGSGSLMIMPSIVGNQHCLKRSEGGVPFAIGQIDPSRGYVHVFDDTTLDVVLKTLDTVSDFIAYLDKKEQFVTSGKLLSAAGEDDLLALYLKNVNEQEEHDFIIEPTASFVTIAEGFWEDFTTNPQRKAQLEANEISYAWDNLIEAYSRHAVAGTAEFESHPGIENHEFVLRFLARENRTRRRLLAKSLLDFMFQIPAHMRATRTVAPSRSGDPVYVFLALPELSSWTYEQYRANRRDFLEGYCLITKLNFPDAEDIIGIATESGRRESGSEDLFYRDAREWTPEMQTEAERIRDEFIAAGYLKEYKHHKSIVKEYPDIPQTIGHQSLPNPMPVLKGRDRNTPCPCGSGKKYKKCHGM